MRRTAVLIVLLMGIVLAACSNIAPTGDSSSDAESAQNQLPSFANYGQTDADNIKDALTRALQVGSLGSGNIIAAGMLERLNTMADCLGNVGAIAGRVYTAVTPPAAGILVLINNTRLTNNFMQCALNPGVEAQREGQQSLQPCAKAGAFSVNSVSYSYIYAATDPSMCSTFDGWLATKSP